MKLIISFALLIGLIQITACSDMKYVKDEQGHVLESFKEDKEGLKHGMFKRFDMAGNLQEEATYIHGKMNGEHYFYYPDGKLELKEQYKNDIINGPFTSYYENGQIKLEFVYNNGVVNGIMKKYYESGALLEEVQMIKNEENGPFKEYHENGKVKWEGQYLFGDNEFGVLKNYDESGELIKKMLCDSLAICRTIWTKEKGNIKLKPLNLKIENIVE